MKSQRRRSQSSPEPWLIRLRLPRRLAGGIQNIELTNLPENNVYTQIATVDILIIK
jgi:hypothetical protein